MCIYTHLNMYSNANICIYIYTHSLIWQPLTFNCSIQLRILKITITNIFICKMNLLLFIASFTCSFPSAIVFFSINHMLYFFHLLPSFYAVFYVQYILPDKKLGEIFLSWPTVNHKKAVVYLEKSKSLKEPHNYRRRNITGKHKYADKQIYVLILKQD